MTALRPSIAPLVFALSCASPQSAGVGPGVQPEARADAHGKVVEVLATQLEATYVFPTIGRRYADALREPEFREVVRHTTAQELPGVLTARLQATHPDSHLRVMGPDAAPEPASAGSPTPTRTPPALEAAATLAPHIAYLRFNLFPGDEDTLRRLSEFLHDSVGSEVLVIDVRGHRGGGLSEMDALFAELFAEETTLVWMETRVAVDRAGGSPIGDGPTLRRVSAPDDVVRRAHIAVPSAQPGLLHTKVYVLVSGYTASAAEHLALAVKRTGRGVIVGEATRGGAHYGGTTDLGAGLSAFVPVGRSYDPDTGEDWEGVGVTPRLVAPAEQALVTALVDHGIPVAEARRIDTELGYRPPTPPGRAPVGTRPR